MGRRFKSYRRLFGDNRNTRNFFPSTDLTLNIEIPAHRGGVSVVKFRIHDMQNKGIAIL